MKKLLGLCMLLCLVGFSHAQLQRTTNLGDITLRFCNDASEAAGTKTAVLETEPEEALELCMYINNDGPSKTTISLNFVDGTITADTDQKKACQPEESKSNFGQYITDYPTTVEIDAGETVKVNAKALFPAGYAGTSYGCSTYQVLDDGATSTTGQTQMFTILSRRANFIDINVIGEYIIDLQAQNAMMEGSFERLSSEQVSVVDHPIMPWNNINEVISQRDLLALRIGKPLITRSVLVNQGNIGLDVTIQSQYQAWRGLVDLEQGIQQQKILPKQSKTVEFGTNNLARWVGGPVRVIHSITYSPIIIGRGGVLDPALLTPQTMTLVTQGFITATVGWSIIALGLLLIIIYIAYRTRNTKKHNKHNNH